MVVSRLPQRLLLALAAASVAVVGAAAGNGGQRSADIVVNERAPAWSPDGARLVYVRELVETENGGVSSSEIYVVNADGSAKRRLTRGAAWNTNPAWSPDGKTILFTRIGKFLGTDSRLFLIRPDGTGLRGERYIAGGTIPASKPAWSPDSSRFALSYGRSIQVHDARVRNWRPLAEGSNPAWSRTNLIAFGRGCGIFTIDPESGHRQAVVGGGGCFPELTRGSPDWSPDGGQLVYVWYDMNRPDPLLFVTGSQGGEQRQLTVGSEPDWSPDGRRIAFWRPSAGAVAVLTLADRRVRELPNRLVRAASGGECTIAGTTSRDALRGTPDRDVLCALAGNDRLDGGAGADVLDGGAGEDLILARDGWRDVIHGGAGRDRALVDRGLDRIRGVERILR